MTDTPAPAKPYSTAGFERTEHVVDGIKVVLYAAGSGPPVVYFHGGGTFHGFDWARDWLDRFQVILPYHPGFGESDDDADIAHMHDYVLHYGHLFEQLGLEDFRLVGASMGGRMAAEYALAYPNTVSRLVLVSPAGLSHPEHPMPDFSVVSPADLPSLFVFDPMFIAPFWPPAATPEFYGERAREGAASRRVQGDPTAEPKLRRRLHRLKSIPTLVLWGDHDRILPVGLAEEWRKEMPNAKVEIVKDAGHLLLDESKAARDVAERFLIAGA